MPFLRLIIFIIGFIVICPFIVVGQYSNPIHYSVKDGLPSSTVYCTAQDSLGFMWIGTEAGLVRFDGTRFKTFTTLDGLPDNEVIGLLYDTTTARLWILTYSKEPSYYRGGVIYSTRNDSTLRVIKCPNSDYISGNIDKDKMLLYNGRFIYDCYGNKIRALEHFSDVDVNQVSSWGDSYDVLNVHGIMRYQEGKEPHIYEASKTDTSEAGTWIGRTLIRFYKGKMIFYEKASDGEYAQSGTVLLPDDLKVGNLLATSEGYIFSTTDHGVFSLDKSLHTIRQLWLNHTGSRVYKDIHGDLWISTVDDGLYILRKQTVTNYTNDNGIANDNITALSVDASGDVIVGNSDAEIRSLSDGKLILKDYYIQAKGKIRHMLFADSLVFIVSGDNTVSDLQTKKGIYLHSQAGGAKCVLRLADGKKILIGLIGSIMEYDLVKRKAIEHPFWKRVLDMAQSKDGTVYCASLDGLYIFRSDTLVHIVSDDRRLHGRMTSLCISADGLLWIGTPSTGVMVYDGKKIVAHINQSGYLGYHGAICRRVVAGRVNEMWVATNDGLNKIKYHLEDTMVVDFITPINMTDGLPSNDVNDVLARDSMVYAATSHGLSVLNQNQLMAPSFIPIYISSVRINDKDSGIHDALYCLDYTHNNLKIEYVGVSLPAGSLRYQYRLLGSGSDRWTTTGNTSIEFRSLSPGAYTFEAVVLDKFGNKSKNVARVQFKITPAFYTTIWFIAGVMLIIFLIGFALIRDRFLRRQLQFLKEQGLNNKIIELEQQALKAQMNPHFIFNCLTAVQHFVNKEDLYAANMYLSNFARLIRQTLDLSGEQYITLDREIAYLESYINLEKLRFQDKFQYSIIVAPDIDEFSVLVPPMLLQPLIENAIRHGLRNREGDKGELTISFEQRVDKVICIIDDNGVGRARAKELKTSEHVEYQSKGMSLTLSRINAINMISARKITIEIVDKCDDNGSATGTMFILVFDVLF